MMQFGPQLSTQNYATARSLAREPRLPLATLTLAGLALQPFTELRFGMMGVGELIILVVAFNLLLQRRSGGLASPSLKIVKNFQIVYLSLMIVSSILNSFSMTPTSIQSNYEILNFGAYFFTAIAVLVLTDARLYQDKSPVKFIERIYIIWGIVFSVLFIFSLATDQLAGFTLRRWGRFTPLVANLHQTAMLFCVLPFIGIALAALSSKASRRLLFLGLSLAFALMAIQSGADKAKLALLTGTIFGSGAFILSYRRGSDPRKVDLQMVWLVLIIASVGFVIWGDWLAGQAVAAFNEADYQGGRRAIYGAAIQTFGEAPLIGGGPSQGVMLGFDMVDPHSTPLDALIKGGIVGLLIFLTFFLRLLKRVFSHPAITAIVISLIPYILAGDVFRRSVYWALIVFALILHDALKVQENSLAA